MVEDPAKIAFQAYARAHFKLDDVQPTELELQGMRAAITVAWEDGYVRGGDDQLKRANSLVGRLEWVERRYWLLSAGWAFFGALIVGFVWLATS